MSITEKDVLHVAKLAKLSFEQEQVAQFTKQMSAIIDMVEELNEVDTTGVPVTTHGVPVVNRFREDVVEEGTNRDELFENVLTKQDGFIKVPAMLDGGGDA